MSAAAEMGRRLIAAVQERGSDAKDVRDAAHEACHAIEYGAKKWDRDSIHAAVLRGAPRPAVQVGAEVRARAVERMVCEELKIEYDSDHWLFMAGMETTKNGIAVPFDFWPRAVESAMKARRVKQLFEEIMELAGCENSHTLRSEPRLIKWKRSEDGYCKSHCGQWKISPLYFGCVKPQWYELRRYGKKVGGMFATQRDAKGEATRLAEKE